MKKRTQNFNQTKSKGSFLRMFSLFVLVLMSTQMSWGQQVIGSFPTMDGGFEGQPVGTTTLSTLSSSLWSTSSNLLGLPGNSNVRTGAKSMNFYTSSTAKRLQSPTTAVDAITNVQYTIQYYYRTATNTATAASMQIGASPNGTSSPTYFPSGAPYTILAASNPNWNKYYAQVTVSTAANGNTGIATIRCNTPTMGVALDIDDFVMYSGGLDTSAPAVPGSATILSSTATQQSISWGASSDVDGGGYMVVRGLADPTTTPNVNGIYAVGNTVATGETVAYIGTNTSFTDLGLTSSTPYYYRIYTVDKAFNYSSAVTINGSTTAPSYAAEPTAQVTGLGITSVSSSGFTINWTPAVSGGGANHLVVVKAGSAISTDPIDGSSYTADAAFSTGTAIGGGKVVYNGTGNSVVVTGLSKALTYYVKVYDFNGSGGSENYLVVSPTSGTQMTSPGEIVSNGNNSVIPAAWTTGSTWVGGVAPSPTDNVTIVAGDKILISSTSSCYNLTIPATAKVYNNTPLPTGSLTYLTVYGTTLVCNGTLGDKITDDSADGALGINFNGDLTISGSGLLRPARIRPNTGTQNATLTIDADMEMTYAGSTGTGGAAIYTDISGNDDITITINSGKTLSFAPMAYFNTSSSTSSNGNANTTINVNGTLSLPSTSYLSLPIASGKTATLNVNGTLNVGRLNVTSSTGGTAPVISVGSGGLISVSTLADFSNATLSATVTGTGTFTLESGAAINVAASSGLDPVAGPIRTTTRNFNAGANYTYSGSTAQVTGSDLPLNVNNLTINNVGGVILTAATAVNNKLSLTSGTLTTGGLLTLKSNATKTAVVGVVTGSISGNVTTERYIPAGQRAYRLLSSPVSTSTFIDANWQLGTHITGAGGATNGFDATTGNNPSMFTYNNTTPAWNALTNTNATVLTSGVPYLTYIRGSRTASLLIAPSDPPVSIVSDATTLSATGTLTTGNVVVNGLNETADGFSAVGNPYQAQVDMQAVLAAGTNLNTLYYYVVDPSLGTRGAYLPVDVTEVASAHISQYLQPGQACFVKTLAAGTASLTFTEANKSEAAAQTTIFKTKNTATPSISLSLYDAAAIRLDVLKIAFDASESNDVNQNDASKMINFDETMASSNNGKLLSIEKRAMPTDADEIPLNITKYRGTSYTIKAEGTGLTGSTPYLFDQFANKTIEIPQEGSVNYGYTVDVATPASKAADRFKLIYAKTLNTIDNEVTSFVLYPNPSKTNSFSLAIPQSMNKASLIVSNMLGQKLYSQNDLQSGNTVNVTVSNVKTAGVYLVSLALEGKTTTTKWIVE